MSNLKIITQLKQESKKNLWERDTVENLFKLILDDFQALKESQTLKQYLFKQPFGATDCILNSSSFSPDLFKKLIDQCKENNCPIELDDLWTSEFRYDFFKKPNVADLLSQNYQESLEKFINDNFTTLIEIINCDSENKWTSSQDYFCSFIIRCLQQSQEGLRTIISEYEDKIIPLLPKCQAKTLQDLWKNAPDTLKKTLFSTPELHAKLLTWQEPSVLTNKEFRAIFIPYVLNDTTAFYNLFKGKSEQIELLFSIREGEEKSFCALFKEKLNVFAQMFHSKRDDRSWDPTLYLNILLSVLNKLDKEAQQNILNYLPPEQNSESLINSIVNKSDIEVEIKLDFIHRLDEPAQKQLIKKTTDEIIRAYKTRKTSYRNASYTLSEITTLSKELDEKALYHTIGYSDIDSKESYSIIWKKFTSDYYKIKLLEQFCIQHTKTAPDTVFDDLDTFIKSVNKDTLFYFLINVATQYPGRRSYAWVDICDPTTVFEKLSLSCLKARPDVFNGLINSALNNERTYFLVGPLIITLHNTNPEKLLELLSVYPFNEQLAQIVTRERDELGISIQTETNSEFEKQLTQLDTFSKSTTHSFLTKEQMGGLYASLKLATNYLHQGKITAEQFKSHCKTTIENAKPELEKYHATPKQFLQNLLLNALVHVANFLCTPLIITQRMTPFAFFKSEAAIRVEQLEKNLDDVRAVSPV